MCIFIDDRGLQSTDDTASCARVYQTVVTADKRRRSQRVEHDVRAKQTKVCDAERAGTYVPNYLKTDGQLIVQGRAAYSTPPLTASLAVVFPPVDNPGCHLDCKTGGRKMAWLPVYSERNSIRKNAMFPVWRPGNTAEPEFLRPAGCMQHIRKYERCVHKKGVKNNAEK